MLTRKVFILSLMVAWATAPAFASVANETADEEITEQAQGELEDLLRDSISESKASLADRKPAVLGPATEEPSERADLYLDYSAEPPAEAGGEN